MSAFLSAPFEILCKISTYLSTPDLAIFSLLSKIFHQASKKQDKIDLCGLEMSYSITELREILSILKYHNFKQCKLPTTAILSDPVINRLLIRLFKSHFMIGAHKYLNDVYFTEIKYRNKKCSITHLTLSGHSQIATRRNYQLPSDLINCMINLNLIFLDINTSTTIRLNEFISSYQTLNTLIISPRNLLSKHNNSLQINFLLKYQNLQRLVIKSSSLTECIDDNNLEIPSKLFICLANWIYNDDDDLTNNDNDEYKYDDINNINNNRYSLRSEVLYWNINLKHLTLNQQYIQLPLDILLSLLAKFKHLETCFIEYCVFIDEYDSANKYGLDSVYHFQTWMIQNDDDEDDEFRENPWKRGLDEELLQYMKRLSLSNKFRSDSLHTLSFKGININRNILKVIGDRFDSTLENITFITCQLPFIQYDWKYFSTKCHKLKNLLIENPALNVVTKCIKNTNGYDLYGYNSPLKITFVTNKMINDQSFKYKNLEAILQDIFNKDSYYEAMNTDKFSNKTTNQSQDCFKPVVRYKLSTNHVGDTIIITEKTISSHRNNFGINNYKSTKYRDSSVNIKVINTRHIKIINNEQTFNEDKFNEEKFNEEKGDEETLTNCEYCGVLLAKLDYKDHIGTQCLDATIKCSLCHVNVKRSDLAYHWLNECKKYETICTICQCVFVGRRDLLKHYEKHDQTADKDQNKYQFNWHKRKLDVTLFTSYPTGTIWICQKCGHRSLNLKVRMAKMIPFKLHQKRGENAEICECCKCPRFLDNFGWKLPK